MNRLRRSLVAGLATACAGPALADYVNVSELVLGTYQADPTLASAPKIPCGSACKHTSLSSAGMSGSYVVTPGMPITEDWSLPFVTSGNVRVPGSIASSAAVTPPPDGVQAVAGSIGTRQRARTNWSSTIGATEPNEVTVQTWKTGAGASVVSYGIRLATPTGNGTQPTFLKFTVPERLRAYSTTRRVQSNQNFYTNPDRAQSRAAVDVYVDGIPVWSSEENNLVPKRFNPPDNTQLQLSWDQPLDGADMTLFLGRLPPGSTRTVAVVMRADLRVDAPPCQNYTGPDHVDYQSCHSQREGLALPGYNSGGMYYHYTPDVQIYTK